MDVLGESSTKDLLNRKSALRAVAEEGKTPRSYTSEARVIDESSSLEAKRGLLNRGNPCVGLRGQGCP